MTQKWVFRYELKPGRWVFAPTTNAIAVGRKIKQAVEQSWKAPGFYYHLRAGGHVDALKAHAANTFFYRADLEDFFGHVNRSRVTRCLKSRFPYLVAREMASESVVLRPGLQGHVLPYGFVQSPILASLALSESRLGTFLDRLHKGKKAVVSVYVDDIIISNRDADALAEYATEVKERAAASGLPINDAKTAGPASEISAFNVDLAHGRLAITPGRMAKLRDSYQESGNRYQREGIESYVRSIDATQVPALHAKA